MQGKPKGAKPAAKADKANARGRSPKTKSRVQERLQPGQLDGLALGYMKTHKGRLPVSPASVARGIIVGPLGIRFCTWMVGTPPTVVDGGASLEATCRVGSKQSLRSSCWPEPEPEAQPSLTRGMVG
jgi:hypothetical protein